MSKLYAIDFILGAETHVIVINAYDRDSAYEEARIRLAHCYKLISASILGTARSANQDDITSAYKFISSLFYGGKNEIKA